MSGRTGSTSVVQFRTPIHHPPSKILMDSMHFPNSRDPREYLQHVMKVTNMACLTPDGALSGDCDFLSGNLYARSLFGKSRTQISVIELPSY